MNDESKLGRRGFLGTSLAIAAGAGVGVALAKAAPPRADRSARFDLALGSFPEVPVAVAVALPHVREGVRGRAWLHIQTPREHLVKDLGPVVFRRGEARIETALAYPYEARVPGEYTYHVEVLAQGERIVTDDPATYALKNFHWFS